MKTLLILRKENKMPKRPIKELRTAKQIAELFNRDVNTVVNWTENGLPHREVRFRTRRLIHPLDVVDYLEARR
jgi:phage terminase Nu1 subunit (DNA packaging protein)